MESPSGPNSSKRACQSENAKVSDFVVADEFKARALDRLDEMLRDYIEGGAETETTVARNRDAIDRLAIKSRVLADVSEIKTETIFLGTHFRMPVCLAPVGGLDALHNDGLIGAAAAAQEFGIPSILSSLANCAQSYRSAHVSSECSTDLQVLGLKIGLAL